MNMNVKPVVILSRGAGVFVGQDGGMEMLSDHDLTKNRISAMLKELGTKVGEHATLLEKSIVSDPGDFDSLFEDRDRIDVLLLCFFGVTPIERLLKWQGPMIAFSGQYTPAMALYAVGEERQRRGDLFVALDYEDIGKTLRILEVKKSLAHTRIVLFGFPPSWHLRWYGFPDLEAIRRKVGLEFVPVELRELIDLVEKVDPAKVVSLADEWLKEANQIVEPTKEQVQQSAAACLAMEQILERKGAQAMAVNCLEITQTRKFSRKIINPCLGMSHLRDKGIPSGCEMDIPGLLTMILLSDLSRKPSFLGNIVHADPEKNVIKLSHCILPTRMAGFDKEPLHYTLRDYHGSKGVTAFTEVPAGVKVTLARSHRNLERIAALTGEVLSCEDTSFCRNTLTIQITDARRFIQEAEGNHHALVFGDVIDDLDSLSRVLDYKFHQIG